jgi:hypothetical protein
VSVAGGAAGDAGYQLTGSPANGLVLGFVN